MPSVVEKQSFGSVEIFWLNRDEAVRRVQEAAQRLIAGHPEVAAVFLFGSLAEGRAVPGSDADILILLEYADGRWIDRPVPLAGYFAEVGLPVEIFCYTQDEAAGNPMARRALRRGMLLAGRGETSPP